MIEIMQFIKWLSRRAWALPGRLHSRLTDSFECIDCFATLFFSSLATFIAGLGVGVILHGITGGHVISAILALIIWITGSVFIVTAGIRAMHRAFRRDQDNVIKRLTE